MALLLAMFQKMRLIREKNQLTLDSTKVSSKKSRITKNIKNVQDRYTSLFAKLESQAKMAQSQFTMQTQQYMGLGSMGMNPWNFGGLGGTSMFVQNMMAQWAKQGTHKMGEDGKPIEDEYVCSSDKAQAIMEAIRGGARFSQYDENNKPLEDGSYMLGKLPVSADEYAAYNQALYQAQSMQQMQQYQAQQMSTQYQNGVSIWLEASKAELEAEQDAVLAPLNEEDSRLDMEKEYLDTRLAQINAEIESYTQLVSQEAKNSAPTFGLG